MKEFSKILIVVDYAILIVLLIASLFTDISMIVVAWVAQIGISTGFYYWKARVENKVKVPLYVLESMPDEFKSEMDLTRVVESILSN